MIVVERIVGEDLNLGIDDTSVTHAGGGTLQGTQINLATFSRTGPAGSVTEANFAVGTLQPLQIVSEVYSDVTGGAELEDLVLVSLYPSTSGSGTVSSLPPHMCHGYVSNPNEVTVVIFNPSSAAIDMGTTVVVRFGVFRLRQVPSGPPV